MLHYNVTYVGPLLHLPLPLNLMIRTSWRHSNYCYYFYYLEILEKEKRKKNPLLETLYNI
jgi:hypothetical protein